MGGRELLNGGEAEENRIFILFCDLGIIIRFSIHSQMTNQAFEEKCSIKEKYF